MFANLYYYLSSFLTLKFHCNDHKSHTVSICLKYFFHSAFSELSLNQNHFQQIIWYSCNVAWAPFFEHISMNISACHEHDELTFIHLLRYVESPFQFWAENLLLLCRDRNTSQMSDLKNHQVSDSKEVYFPLSIRSESICIL